MSRLLVTKRLFSTIVGKVALLQTFVEQHEFIDRMFWKRWDRYTCQVQRWSGENLPKERLLKTKRDALSWRTSLFVGLHVRCFSHWGLLAYGAC